MLTSDSLFRVASFGVSYNKYKRETTVFPRIEKLKATAWEKAEKYDAGHNRRVLLAVLIGVGMISVSLLKFIWVALNAAIKDEKNHNSSSFDRPEDVILDNFALTNYGRRHGDPDHYGRMPGNPFYGKIYPDPTTKEMMDEKWP